MGVERLLRDAVGKVTRGVVIKRSLPEEFGGIPLLTTPEAGLRYLFSSMDDIDPMLYQITREYIRPGDTVWDVGANVGLFTFCAAAIAGAQGKVLAVEADIWLAQLLRRSASLQTEQVAEVEVLPVAISGEPGLRRFQIAARSRSANFLEGYGTTEAGGTRNTQLVMSVSLDWLGEKYPLPQVLKIDVEGAEVEVLEGAREVLTRARPVLLIEVAGENQEEVRRIFSEVDYTYQQLTPHDVLGMPVERNA